MALDGLKRRLLGSVGLLKGKREVDEETVKELSRSLRRALIEADFNVRQTKELTERVERRMIEEEPRPGTKLETHAMNLIYTELVRLLGPPREIRPHNETVLMVGLYGQGKTGRGDEGGEIIGHSPKIISGETYVVEAIYAC